MNRTLLAIATLRSEDGRQQATAKVYREADGIRLYSVETDGRELWDGYNHESLDSIRTDISLALHASATGWTVDWEVSA